MALGSHFIWFDDDFPIQPHAIAHYPGHALFRVRRHDFDNPFIFTEFVPAHQTKSPERICLAHRFLPGRPHLSL